ncbi:MAG: histidine phosphatase family protein [Nitrospirota bacterium]|nr:histidine phosphatase family protein [Nitrospirota bacterium]
MKTLYLSRHAKSSWNSATMSDHARPLNERGEQDAPRMGKRLRKRMPQPQIIISSSAVRAETTATILAEAIDYPLSEIRIDERLYGAEPKNVISIIRELDDAIDCAMLVGHNPTFTHLINALSGSQIENVPTCGMAVLRFPTDTWSKIGQVQGELLDFDYPKKTTD